MYAKRPPPRAVSHRGFHDSLPENSIPAFLAAIEAGAEAIELDIHSSVDDVLFVHHDPFVPGPEGSRSIASLDSRELSQIRLQGEIGIPTLDETIDAIGSRAGVFIEIKARGIESTMVRCLRRHPENMEAYAVHAFDHRIIRRMVELIPSVRTGVLQVSYLMDTCAAMRAAGATDLWQHADFIDSSLVIDVHACGGRVIAWTPNSESQWDTLAASGVDAICTDRIDRYVSWRTAIE